MRVMIFGAILTLVSGCAIGSDSFCLTYIPIPTDDLTPEHVQLVIDDNNTAYEALRCR